MSILVDFEKRSFKDMYAKKYLADDVDLLLHHARALEAMLRQIEFSDPEARCHICGWFAGHTEDCELARLLK